MDHKADLAIRSCSSSTRFIYRPLKDPLTSIRILKVLPHLLDGHIQVLLMHVRNPATYRCLSYAWGEADQFHDILVNGQALTVRENLYDFLNAARRRLPGRALWIDAICIAQNDKIEKSQQVQRMGQIYRESTEVLIWLGAQPDLDHVFDFVNTLVRQDLAASARAEFSQLVVSQHERIDIGLRRLCTNAYWQRAWIAQEILLAQQVRILNGTRHAEWRSVVRTVKEVRKCIPQKSDEIFFNCAMVRFWDEWPWAVPGSLTYLRSRSIWHLDWVWNSHCSDPRDRIYSLLALLDDHGFEVDYEEDACSLFWRAGEHFRAWNGGTSVRNLCQALQLNASSIADSLRSSSPRYISFTATHVRFPDEYDPSPSVCEFCGTRLDKVTKNNVSLCMQDLSKNKHSHHAILQPTPDGSFTISLRPSYIQGNRILPRTLAANAFQYFVHGQRVELQGFPTWESEVPGSEYRICLPADVVVENLKGMEHMDSFLRDDLVTSTSLTKDKLELHSDLL